jgi:hypothetical protein
MTALGNIQLGTLRGTPGAPSDKATVLSDSNAAANQLTKTFDYQSYFDSTLLEKAVLPQAPNNPIIQSTLEQQQLSGRAIGNHPDSQTPVAVVFSGDGRQSGSAIHLIPPGAIVRPAGSNLSDQSAFQSFSWGLPFGWLGGGTATIVVFQTPEAWASWNPRPQILFHRFRAQIYAPGGLPAAGSLSSSWPRNWPMRFPSLLTRRSATSIPQGGAPQIAISQPGQVMFSLQTTLGSQSQMKALFYHTTDFSDELAAQPTPIPLQSVEFAVPARTPYVYTAGYTEYTMFEGPAALSRIGCDGKNTSIATLTAGVVFVSDDPALQGQYIDVARYGYL